MTLPREKAEFPFLKGTLEAQRNKEGREGEKKEGRKEGREEGGREGGTILYAKIINILILVWLIN